MSTQKIAIVGMGRIGSAFFKQMQARRQQGIELLCVAEVGDTPGRRQAMAEGVSVRTMDEIVALGGSVDVLFDLTGLPAVRRELREKMSAAGNRHTVIASESIVRVIWSLITDETLPEIEGRTTGY